MMFQFSNMINENDDFEAKWETMIQSNDNLKDLVKLESNTTKKFENCPKLATLKTKIPPEIWEASNIDENFAIQV